MQEETASQTKIQQERKQQKMLRNERNLPHESKNCDQPPELISEIPIHLLGE